MESLHNNVQLMLEFLKAPFLVLHFSCFAHLNILVHDMINLLYYEYWTDKQKYLYVLYFLFYKIKIRSSNFSYVDYKLEYNFANYCRMV